MLGHSGGGHSLHSGGQHAAPPMPNTPSGPNTLSSNQSNKASSSVVSSKIKKIFDDFR